MVPTIFYNDAEISIMKTVLSQKLSHVGKAYFEQNN